MSRLYEEALIEFHPCGGAVKVTAMDPRSLTEVTVMGPAGASRVHLERLALRKLDYVMRRQAERRRHESGRDSDDQGWLA